MLHLHDRRGDGRVRACHGIEAEGEAPERRWANGLHLPQQGRAAEGRRRLRPGVQGAERQVREEGKDGASRWHDTAYAASHVLHGDGEGRDEPEGAAIHHGP